MGSRLDDCMTHLFDFISTSTQTKRASKNGVEELISTDSIRSYIKFIWLFRNSIVSNTWEIISRVIGRFPHKSFASLCLLPYTILTILSMCATAGVLETTINDERLLNLFSYLENRSELYGLVVVEVLWSKCPSHIETNLRLLYGQHGFEGQIHFYWVNRSFLSDFDYLFVICIWIQRHTSSFINLAPLDFRVYGHTGDSETELECSRDFLLYLPGCFLCCRVSSQRVFMCWRR